MNMRTHEAWKQMFIRDQFAYDELSNEYKDACWRATDNDSAHVALLGA